EGAGPARRERLPGRRDRAPRGGRREGGAAPRAAGRDRGADRTSRIVVSTGKALLLASLAALVLPLLSHARRPALHPCSFGGVQARCGMLSVLENRWLPHGRRIDLHVVVIPALERPARPDAFTYLAGGPGGAATSLATSAASLWPGIHVHHDILLVDQ